VRTVSFNETTIKECSEPETDLAEYPVNLKAGYLISWYTGSQRLQVKYYWFLRVRCCGPESGPFWSDPDVWDRIRILALINDYV
jgi:hypothetical protein